MYRLAVAPLLFAAFFVGAVGEEVGWQGYAFDPMEARWGTAGAALLMGVLWALWHVIPYIEAGRPSAWIVWQCVNSVGLRALIVWLYIESGRSVFAVIVFHAMITVTTCSPTMGRTSIRSWCQESPGPLCSS
jgi:hypothetical protein